MKPNWTIVQKHHDDVNSLGPKDGLHKDKDGFVRKYEGKKVQEALKNLGHSSLVFENCSCKAQS